MSTLSERHAAIIDQFMDTLPQLVSVSKIKEILRVRAAQLDNVLADKDMSDRVQWMALGELNGLKAVRADLDALLEGR